MSRLAECDRSAWLHDLASDAPTVVSVLERLLREQSPLPDTPDPGASDPT